MNYSIEIENCLRDLDQTYNDLATDIDTSRKADGFIPTGKDTNKNLRERVKTYIINNINIRFEVCRFYKLHKTMIQKNANRIAIITDLAKFLETVDFSGTTLFVKLAVAIVDIGFENICNG